MSVSSSFTDAPVKIGLLGLNFGEKIARRIVQDIGCLQLEAICDLNQEKLKQCAEAWGTKAYSSLDEMLTDPAIEAVALFTGPIGRAQMIRKIIQSGRHVLTTKPFEMDVEATRAVLAEAHQLDKVIQLNSPGPQPPEDISIILQWAQQYGLGRAVSFHAATWAHYREKANGTWYDDPELCPAPPIFRLGIYFLNDFAPFLGEPEAVHVMQSRLFTERPTADHAQLSIEFKQGGLATVFASFCVQDGQPYRDEVTLNFEKGTVRRWIVRENKFDMNEDYARLELSYPGGNLAVQTAPGAYAGWYQWETFARAVRSGKGLTTEQADRILYGVRLLEAMKVSSQSGLRQAVKS